MTRLVFSLAAALAALTLPGLAAAKEPARATISGPGFQKTLRLLEHAEFSGTPLADLTEASGFFPSAFGQSPDPMLQSRPGARLGARYTITWTVPGPPGTPIRKIRQDVYPYARGGAVTYTRPGQPIFDVQTLGGWYRNPELKATLVRLGLPARAPRPSAGRNDALLLGLGIPGVLAAAGGLAVYLRRRRRQPSARPEVAV